MTDIGSALLQAIIDEPEGDTHRLVAAVVEIERLEAENARLREALKPLAEAEWYSMICCGHKAIGIFAEDIERAKKALL